MTILKVKNRIGENERKERKLIKALDFKLPKGFRITFNGSMAEIDEKDCSWLPFWHRFVWVYLQDDSLHIIFKSVEDYAKLRPYLLNSKTKFKVTIGEDYYY